MRHLKRFSLFEAQTPNKLTLEQQKFLNRYTEGTWSVNPSTGLVDVKGSFDCPRMGLKDLKGIKFGHVTGNFDCYYNNLKTLEGAPQTVGRYFDCSHNFLQTLEGAPQTVGGDFRCDNNSLQTLKGAPQTVGEDFYCYGNNLKTLEGAPQTVGGDFWCSNNSLKTLEGAPQTVGGDFDCENNSLQTLEGAPQTVGGEFKSDHVKIPEGEWSFSTLVEIYLKSKGKEKKLLGTLVSPEAIQKAIDENPEKAAVELKGKLKDLMKTPGYRNLKFPERLQVEVDLLTNLSDVGL